jgi:methyl-accepting chemotaxis protein
VARASQRLAEGSSEQAAAVEETSASLEEMSSMIHSTANNALQAKNMASEAQNAAQSGTATMGEMTAAMKAIEQSSAEVAKIVKSIDEIAFQTNILALNAAVEAARAGEAGAGFAVVADEVRSLAQRSAAAAQETAEKIEAAIHNSRNGSQSLVKVGNAFTKIGEKVRQTDAFVAEIAMAAKEQALGIEQISTAIGQMSKVTQSSATNAEQSASAAEELSAQSGVHKGLTDKLREVVGLEGLQTSPSNLGTQNDHSTHDPTAGGAHSKTGVIQGASATDADEFKDF